MSSVLFNSITPDNIRKWFHHSEYATRQLSRWEVTFPLGGDSQSLSATLSVAFEGSDGKINALCKEHSYDPNALMYEVVVSFFSQFFFGNGTDTLYYGSRGVCQQLFRDTLRDIESAYLSYDENFIKSLNEDKIHTDPMKLIEEAERNYYKFSLYEEDIYNITQIADLFVWKAGPVLCKLTNVDRNIGLKKIHDKSFRISFLFDVKFSEDITEDWFMFLIERMYGRYRYINKVIKPEFLFDKVRITDTKKTYAKPVSLQEGTLL